MEKLTTEEEGEIFRLKTGFTPLGFIWDHTKCMLLGIIVFMVLVVIISYIPVIGKYIKSTAQWTVREIAYKTGSIEHNVDESYV